MSRCDACKSCCDSTCRQPGLWEQGMERNDTCDKCGKMDSGIGWFAAAFRKSQIKRGYPDPGNLCGNCAGGITGPRIADEILKEKG